MKSYKLLSVDIWDTVLRRCCHPDEVKLFTARYLFLKYHGAIAANYRDPKALLRERQRCEGEIGSQRKSGGADDEYTITHVLTCLLNKVLNVDCGLDIPALVEELIDKEVEQEKRVTYLDAEICATIKDITHEQLVYISDFYLSSHKLNQILEANCCPLPFNQHFVSCDVGLNKRSSRLFGKVHEELGIEPDEHLHLGDNPVADVEAPQRRGIVGRLFHHDAEERKRARLRRAFESRGEGLSAYLTEMLARTRNQPVAEGRTDSALVLYQIGQELAPLLLGFVLYVIEQAMIRRADKIFYFTREGEFFRAIHQELTKYNLFSLPVPQDELLEVSRLSTFGPSLRQFGTDELMRIWSLYSTQSLAALFTSLGVDMTPFANSIRDHDIDPDRPIEYPWQDPRVQELFRDEGFRQGVETQLAANRQKLYRYLKQKGFAANSTQVFVVDIGWQGAIQDNLAYLFEHVQVDGLYLGLQPFLNEQPVNTTKTAFGPDGNDREDWSAIALRYVAPIEMICNSPNGNTVGYREQDGRMVAVRVNSADEDQVFHAFTQHLQAGVLSAIPAFADMVAHHAVGAEELQEACKRLWMNLVFDPPRPLAKAFFSLAHKESFGVGGFLNKRKGLPLVLMAKAGLSRSARGELAQFLEKTSWPHGYFKLYRLPLLASLYNIRVLNMSNDSRKSSRSAGRSDEKDRIIAEQGRMLEERWAAMQEMERMIEGRDRIIADLRRRQADTAPETAAGSPVREDNK